MKPAPAFVTTALPYANGPLHLGHLVGYIQADIWVRARRMAGGSVHFVCADDAHGTPIMLAAEKAGASPEDFIRAIQVGHERDFADFGVAFDHYHSTHSDENRELATLIYTRLRDGTHGQKVIARRSISQLYDPVKQMFLPDRYIKGECPNCGSPDQYGDNCEVCGKAYSPTDLKNPKSVVSGATPELRDSEHYFFELGKFEAFLREWMAGDVAHPSVKAKLNEWLEGGLRDWDISRDAPYFGFPIPDAPGKFFYVWLDAPIGYLASFKAFCAKTGVDFDSFLHPEPNATEMHHFLGKDIINFHGLFWPAMLHGAGFRAPTQLHVNGYLTVNGAKMSKSRGTFIMARTFLDAGLNPETLRYYFAAKSGAGVDDLDLNLEDYAARVNSDLVGKFVNIASRCAGFISKRFDGQLAATLPEPATYTHFVAGAREVRDAFAAGEFNQAIRQVMALADEANRYIDLKKPWAVASELDNTRVELLLAEYYKGEGWLVDRVPFGEAGYDLKLTREGKSVLVEYKHNKASLDAVFKLREALKNTGAATATLIVNGPISAQVLRAANEGPTLNLIDESQLRLILGPSLDEPLNPSSFSIEDINLQAACTQGLNLFRVLAATLKPVLPQICARAEAFLQSPVSSWDDVARPLLGCKINTYEPLLTRIDPKQIEAMIEASKDSLQPNAEAVAPVPAAKPSAPTKPAEPAADSKTISIEDFARLDLRIGKVIECGFVEGSDKLLRFRLDAGELGERQIFSGIRASYGEPEKLVGRKVVFIANLAPRKMRFGLSEGMILSAGDDSGLFLLDADSGAMPGMPVK